VYGPEPKEGIASFQEKRPADWRKFRDGEGPDPATPPLSQKGKKPAAKPAAKKAAPKKAAAAPAAKKTTAAKKPAAPRMTSAAKGATGGRKATTRRPAK
jgi:hypothetical protein